MEVDNQVVHDESLEQQPSRHDEVRGSNQVVVGGESWCDVYHISLASCRRQVAVAVCTSGRLAPFHPHTLLENHFRTHDRSAQASRPISWAPETRRGQLGLCGILGLDVLPAGVSTPMQSHLVWTRLINSVCLIPSGDDIFLLLNISEASFTWTTSLPGESAGLIANSTRSSIISLKEIAALSHICFD